MSIGKEFRAFILKGNIIDLAVAVVIGGAFGKIVAAFVDDLVMPVVSVLLPGGDWRNFTATPLHLKLGHLVGSVVDFVIIAFVVFLTLVKLLGTATKDLLDEAPAAAAPPPATKTCGECLETIAAAARRCKSCGQPA